MATKLRKGLIQLYTGEGKGKTSAALGLAFRAIGMGLRVYFVQFLKPRSTPSGEVNTASRLTPRLRLVRLGDDSFLGPVSDAVRRRTEGIYAQELDRIQQIMQQGEYDIFILDELVNALHLGLVNWGQVERLVEAKPLQVELVFTGQPAPPRLIELADLVSELRMVKHPYRQGVKSRPGIEY
jgi:cob(I)alamin adenosyltransferase